MLVDDAADDRRRGRAVVNPEARRIALKAFRPQCLLHGLDDGVAIDDQILAQLISAVEDDMNMGMAGIKMVHRDPIELRSQVSFEFAHEVAGKAGEVAEAHTVLGRDDDAKLVAVVLAAIEEGIDVGPVLRRGIQPAALAIARGAVALNITHMSGGATALSRGT